LITNALAGAAQLGMSSSFSVVLALQRSLGSTLFSGPFRKNGHELADAIRYTATKAVLNVTDQIARPRQTISFTVTQPVTPV
jgi:hypothetical protein